MSSPLHSLKKGPKSRMFVGTGLSLDNVGQRPVPFRQPNYTDDESRLLDEITTNMATNRIKAQNISTTTGSNGPSPLPSTGSPSLPKLTKNTSSRLNHMTHSSGPTDHDLMSLMMNKVTLLEQRVQFQNKEMSEKDKRVRILEDKIRIMKNASESNEPGQVKELEKKCLLLQQQIHEMETFLSDYGMIWMGEKSSEESEVYLEEEEEEEEEETEDEGMWRPGSSVSSIRPHHLDYDQLIENIKDLNILAGEGVAKVTKTTDGARLKIPEAIPLTLFRNGIMLYQGPFRPFSDPETQLCIQDLMDGYFPSELQHRYPDGIPFAVSDKRDIKFSDKRNKKIFEGSGQILGGETKPSRLIPSKLAERSGRGRNITESDSRVGLETSEIPGGLVRVDDLLNKLPKSVIRDGKVIDIRNSIGQHIKGDGNNTVGVSVVETPVSLHMMKRLEENGKRSERPVTPRNITTLRIKSECGNHTYIVKMKFTDTIGELKQYLQKHRPGIRKKFTVMSTYPTRSYTDDTATLEDCGLVPNAVLHLRSIPS
ncbi:hypothetical protein LOTGIDRAFT_233217 [Lottia gigantea]|uniref:UBX domain-containing protein 11 n=1 Tax=Lottia gigantea TaxID=225164 RepID=V3ZLB7_LOTGI|nr:hypothetical protein LOTGIDRAFT_233217 [Lottia gigantea]ESO92168.1 hypothetical protein LOTGIDRAFT_233217 [Lottia gigantea]